jgi:hypothetical protein
MPVRRRYEKRSRRPNGKQRSRDPRRNADLGIEPVWVDVCGRRMFVAGYTPGAVPYGVFEDEMDDSVETVDDLGPDEERAFPG